MKSHSLPKHMTVDEFLVWSEQQEEGKYELFDGEVVRQSHDGESMQAERILHGETKGRAFLALSNAIAKSGLKCWTMVDSASVRVNAKKTYLPDVLVYCGEKADPRALEVRNPVILVEVLSEGTASRDLGDKFIGYFTLPSVAHYLIVDPDKALVIHHARGDGDEIRTRILRDGEIVMAPPGIRIALADLFV